MGRISAVILCIILSGAAYTDLRHRKVCNCWLLSGFILEGALGGLKFFLPAILFFPPVFLLFRMRLMGAGDGKLIMLIAGSLGLYHGSLAVFSGFTVAVLMSLIRILREKSLGRRILRLVSLAGQILHTGSININEAEMITSRENSIPLAACLSAGTIIYIFILANLT